MTDACAAAAMLVIQDCLGDQTQLRLLSHLFRSLQMYMQLETLQSFAHGSKNLFQ